MKIIYRAGDITEAEIVKGMLYANGIDAHVSGYYLQGGIGELAPTDLAKVHVPDEDYDRAEKLVREYEGSELVQTGADQKSEYAKPTPTNKIFVTIIVIIVISVLGYWVGV